MLLTEWCPSNSYIKIVPQNISLYGNGVIPEVIGSDDVILEYGGPLIQYNRCPYEREFGQRHTEGECHLRNGVKPRSYQKLGGNSGPSDTLISHSLPPEL